MFNKGNIQKVADLLIRNRHTIAVAESVTSGFLQGAFSSAENAVVFFRVGSPHTMSHKSIRISIEILPMQRQLIAFLSKQPKKWLLARHEHFQVPGA